MVDIHIKEAAPKLLIKAGPQAWARLRKEGFDPDLFSHVAAAAGGPKWLVLNRLDRVLFGEWLHRPHRPLTGIGSSIGAWRLACIAQPDVPAAIDRFEAAYLAQSYSQKPDATEVAAEAARILEIILQGAATEAVLNSQRLRINIVTTLCHGLLGTETPAIQMLGLLKVVAANAVSRRWFARCVQRVVFHAADAAANYAEDGFRTRYVTLADNNLQQALLGTAAIPLVITSARDIPGGPQGTYRDGGLIDYHMDLPLQAPAGLMLLPHFSERVVPGWFDRSFKRRRPQHLDNAVLLAPSVQMLARLPNGKIPDRKDFALYGSDNAARISAWRRAIAESQAMADDWQEWLSADRLVDNMQPLQE